MLNKLRKLQNKKGFTLVELIVVIAIIAILTAVIVPLVGRYSAQATYTTLNDSASTVSSGVNTAISTATQMGSVSTSEYFIGIKSTPSGTGAVSQLVVTSSTKDASNNNKTAKATAATTAVEATGSGGTGGTLSGITDIDVKICALIADELFATLPSYCVFYVAVKGNAVTGVVYTTDSTYGATLGAMTADPSGFARDTDFENAYLSASTSGVAVGLSGKFIPA